MKGKSLIAIGVLAAIVGAILLISHKSITSAGVIVTGGILFVAVGLANLIIYGQADKTNSIARLFNHIANSAAIVLGICMLVFESTFTPLVTFIFGLLVAICALWQFFLLAIGTRPYQLPAWLYAFPILIGGVAAYIFIKAKGSDDMVILSTGIACALLGLASIIEGIALGSARHTTYKQQKAETKAAAKAAESLAAPKAAEDAPATVLSDTKPEESTEATPAPNAIEKGA